MILKLSEIADIIKRRPNRRLVQQAQDYSKKLTMHMTGIGLDSYLARIDYYEKQVLFDLRRKYARSNKDFFARLHRPIDKIFSASGGSVYYDLPEGPKRDLVSRLQDVEWGHSLRQWIRTFWLPAYHYDPMGLIQIEVDEKGDAYPTYKTSATIYDYKLNGRQPEYVVYETDVKLGDEQKPDGRKVYRVLDDMCDYLVAWDGAAIEVLAGKSYMNHFGKVPAFVISDLYDAQRGMYISADDAVVELADEYLRYGGILNVYVNRHGFPQQWRYMGVCDTCKGVGTLNGDTCPACNGTGHKTKYDVAEDINLPIPEQGQPTLAPPVGNIEAAVQSWDKMDATVERLYNLAWQTKWGNAPNVRTQGASADAMKTATETILDEQPKVEALHAYSESAERAEQRITDLMGEYFYGALYKGAEVNYGKRFVIESADKIMDNLLMLMERNAPYEVIREKQEEYYHALYQSDSLKLNVALKLIDVEPLPFYGLAVAKDLLSPKEYLKKCHYNDWRGLKHTKDRLLSATVEELRALLEQYALERGV